MKTTAAASAARRISLPIAATPTKRQIKRNYLRANVELSDAVAEVMLHHDMMYGEALRYLMREPASAK
jgi:hypothetical protein